VIVAVLCLLASFLAVLFSIVHGLSLLR